MWVSALVEGVGKALAVSGGLEVVPKLRSSFVGKLLD